MKKISHTLALLIMLLFTSVSLIGQSKTLDLERFDGLSVAGNIELILIPDSKNFAEIEVDDVDMDKLETRMKGSTLKFNLKGNGFFNLFNRTGKGYIRLHYTEDLIKISSSASADIRSNSIVQSDDLKVSASSGSRVELEMECNSIEATVSSGANIELNGSFEEQDVRASSGGTYKATTVESKKAVAKASSGGSVKIWATDKLKGRASSGGSVDYKGNPGNSDISSSSGGSVRKRESMN